MNKILFNHKIVNVWSEKERDEFRANSNLPILKSRKDFISRLRDERVVIVIAETGSGKTTQLPQYMADAFKKEEGIIFVTQPRALAAISIAERVGFEYDGPKIGKTGYSVGYKVGKDSTQSRTNRIVFMTDAQLIKEMMNDNFLSKVRGLLIDEAHERSVNTDIVLGKIILKKYCIFVSPYLYF